jgi:hypothetical protein
MADNLDDFFAKRDKKKPKGKKFATADDAGKILQDKAKERKKLETTRTTYVPPLNDQGEAPAALSEYRQQQADDDDEWKEVEEVKPDYTGLKIQELVLEDDDDDFGGTKDPEVKEEGEEDKNGPWNKVGAKDKDEPKSEAQIPVVEPSKAEVKAVEPESVKEVTETADESVPATEEPPKKTGGYVPPARRQELAAKAAEPSPAAGPAAPSAAPASSTPAGKYVPPSRRGGGSDSATSSSGAKKKPTAPLEMNDESFPTLGS